MADIPRSGPLRRRAPQTVTEVARMQGDVEQQTRDDLHNSSERIRNQFEDVGAIDQHPENFSLAFMEAEASIRRGIEQFECGAGACVRTPSMDDHIEKLQGMCTDLKKIAKKKLLKEKAKLFTEYLRASIDSFKLAMRGGGAGNEATLDQFFSSERFLRISQTFVSIIKELELPLEVASQDLADRIIDQDDIGSVTLKLIFTFQDFKSVFTERFGDFFKTATKGRADEFIQAHITPKVYEQLQGPLKEASSYADRVLKYLIDKHRVEGFALMASLTLDLGSKARYHHGRLVFSQHGTAVHSAKAMGVGSTSILFGLSAATAIYSAYMFRKQRKRKRVLNTQRDELKMVAQGARQSLLRANERIAFIQDRLVSRAISAENQEKLVVELKEVEKLRVVSISLREKAERVLHDIEIASSEVSRELVDRTVEGTVNSGLAALTVGGVSNAIKAGTVSTAAIGALGFVGMGAAALGVIFGTYKTVKAVGQLSQINAKITLNRANMVALRRKIAENPHPSPLARKFNDLEFDRLVRESETLRLQRRNQLFSIASGVFYTIAAAMLLASMVAANVFTAGVPFFAFATTAFFASGFISSTTHYLVNRFKYLPEYGRTMKALNSPAVNIARHNSVLDLAQLIRNSGLDSPEVQELIRRFNIPPAKQEDFIRTPESFITFIFE